MYRKGNYDRLDSAVADVAGEDEDGDDAHELFSASTAFSSSSPQSRSVLSTAAIASTIQLGTLHSEERKSQTILSPLSGKQKTPKHAQDVASEFDEEVVDNDTDTDFIADPANDDADLTVSEVRANSIIASSTAGSSSSALKSVGVEEQTILFDGAAQSERMSWTSCKYMTAASLVFLVVVAVVLFFKFEEISRYDNLSTQIAQNQQEIEWCRATQYAASELQIVSEYSFKSLFRDTQDQSLFMASGIAFQAAGQFEERIYVSFHNLPAVAEIKPQLFINDAENQLLFQGSSVLAQGWNGIGIENLQGKIFLFHHEPPQSNNSATSAAPSMAMSGNGNATIQEVNHSGQLIGPACAIILGNGFLITSPDISSIQPALMSADDQPTFFALCRRPFCNSSVIAAMPNAAPGVLLPLTTQTTAGSCILGWKERNKLLFFPPEVNFTDFVALALFSLDWDEFALAVASSDGDVWVSEIDIEEELAIQNVNAGLYHFPRDPNCRTSYCSVEGLAFLNTELLVAATGSSLPAELLPTYAAPHASPENAGHCFPHDQSIVVFSLPYG